METRHVLVVGAGTMGNGIAQVAAQSGYAVTMFDIDEKAVAAGMKKIRSNLDKGVEKGKANPDRE